MLQSLGHSGKGRARAKTVGLGVAKLLAQGLIQKKRPKLWYPTKYRGLKGSACDCQVKIVRCPACIFAAHAELLFGWIGKPI